MRRCPAEDARFSRILSLLFEGRLADTLLCKVTPPEATMTVLSLRSRLAACAEWPLPLCVLAVGILGLVDHSRLARNLTLIDVHALFGLGLWAFVLVRFRRRMRLVPRPGAADIRAISRHLSRMIYLLLGLAVAFKELVGADAGYLRDYLLYALAALTLVRLVALLYWGAAQRRLARTAAQATLAQGRLPR